MKLKVAVLVLVVFFLFVWKFCDFSNDYELPNDPIPTIGHGSFFNASGETFTPDVKSIVKAKKLLEMVKNQMA